MEKFSILDSVMEAGNQFKNGAISKSLMSKENIVRILIIDNECCTENMRQFMSYMPFWGSAVRLGSEKIRSNKVDSSV